MKKIFGADDAGVGRVLVELDAELEAGFLCGLRRRSFLDAGVEGVVPRADWGLGRSWFRLSLLGLPSWGRRL